MSAMDEGLAGLLGPAFKRLIPMIPLPARSRGSLRDSPFGNRLGAIPAPSLPCHSLSLAQRGWQGPSQCHTGRTGKLREPKHELLSHVDLLFAPLIPTAHWNALDPGQDQSEVVGLGDVTRDAKSFAALGSRLTPSSSGAGYSQATCLGASHPHRCTLTLSFRGSPLLTPPGKENWGLLRAPGFSG